MRSSYPLSLFSGPPPREGAPSAAVVSLVFHGVLLAAILASAVRVRVVHRQQNDLEDTARMIDLRKPAPAIEYAPPKSLVRHSVSALRALSSGGSPQRAHISQVARVSRNFKTSLPAPQTLIQPDVPLETRTLPHIPVPQIVVWTPGKVVSQRIVTPAPTPLATIQARPTLRVPNAELQPSDIALSATQFTDDAPLPQPSTTTPMDIIAQRQAQRIPVTASQQAAQLSPARVLSISNLKMNGGTEALPAVNEIAAAQMPGSPSEGVSAGSSPDGNDASGSGGNGSGSGQGNGNGSNAGAGIAPSGGGGGNPAKDTASGPGYTVTGGDDTGAIRPDSPSAEHITLSPAGQYGMVVIGASPQENYPEVQDLWTGRLVFTVYLRSNTARNWILQYSLPQPLVDPSGGSSADPPASSGGNPTAPWAFNIMRPDLGAYSGTVLVHGFITPEGRFAALSVVFPPDFSKATLLLRALKLWQFRPAMVQGTPVTVETLLIVPGAQG